MSPVLVPLPKNAQKTPTVNIHFFGLMRLALTSSSCTYLQFSDLFFGLLKLFAITSLTSSKNIALGHQFFVTPIRIVQFQFTFQAKHNSFSQPGTILRAKHVYCAYNTENSISTKNRKIKLVASNFRKFKTGKPYNLAYSAK